MTVKEQSEITVGYSFAERAAKVREAADAMRQIVASSPDGEWTARDLQEDAGEGRDWSSSVKSLAFWSLVEAGDIVIDDDLVVRRPAA